MMVVYPHLHRRRTGLTTSLEQIIIGMSKKHAVFVFGYGISSKYKNSNIFKVILEILKSHGTVVWHCGRNNEAIVGLLLKIFMPKVKVIYTRHSDSKPSWITRILLNKSDTVISLTKKVQKSLGIKSEYCPHGVDIRYYYPEYEACSDNLTFLNGYKIISVVGRIRPDKGQHVVIDELTNLLNKRDDIRLLVVGRVQKKHRQYMQGMLDVIKGRRLDEKIIFMDEMPDIRCVYKVSDIVIVPSFTEGFSMVPLEAMAMGVPVIASGGVGIHDEIITNGVNGWLFNASNSGQLTRLVSDFYNLTDEFSSEISALALNNICEHWSVDVEVNKLAAIYNKVIGN